MLNQLNHFKLEMYLLVTHILFLGPATWARSSAPSDPSVDSGTASWGKSFDAPSGWGESSEPGKGGGWGNSHSHSAKSGMSLSMYMSIKQYNHGYQVCGFPAELT